MKSLLKQQIEYYKARAGEYDQWYLRKGRYNHGEKLNQQQFKEVEEVQKALQRFDPRGIVLELACGTGWWTQQLVKYATSITAIDASPEVIAINKLKVQSKKVKYIKLDLFKWKLTTRFDVVFFSFWLSHVPEELFHKFWSMVRSALKPKGRVFFIDNLKSEGHGGNVYDLKNQTGVRTLKDGRSYKIVKIFYEPKKLKARLHKSGWNIEVDNTKNYFLYGYG